MLKLSLLRHAKSSWSVTKLNDFDRPLKKRGYNDIFTMAERFLEYGYHLPDQVISSPALRAASTAQLFCDGIGFKRDRIHFIGTIYESTPVELYKLISQTPADVSHLMLVGHNPGLTYLAVELCQLHTTNVPTTGFVHIKLKIDKWAKLQAGCGKLLNYDYPKRVES